MIGLAVSLALTLGACGTDAQPAAVALKPPGDWSPWVLPAASAVEVPPPPRAGSAAARADERAVATAVAARTSEQEQIARDVARTPAVDPWLERAMSLVAARAKDPPTASRNYALVAVAMHDAAIAAYHYKRRYGRPAPDVEGALERPADPSYPSEHAAIASAAADVLAALYPEAPAADYRQEAVEIGEARMAAGASRPSDVEAGADLGRSVAARVIQRARTDGADREWTGKPPGGAPRYYSAPPGTAGRPVSPLAGTWRTWVLSSGRALRPPAPPRFGTPKFDKQVREVVRAKAELTPRQEMAARFWAGGEGTPLPPGVWIQVVLSKLKAEPVSTPVATRTLALLTVSMADAGVSAWDAKYAYWDPRPENAVRDSGLEPRWKPLLETPFFPSYVSGHATYSGAAAEVLSDLYPREAAVWRARAKEAADSRIWGGIHWPLDGSVGLEMGRRIGKLVVGRAQKDTPGR